MMLPPNLQALAWALLHFLWQGLLLGIAAALAFRLARHRGPRLRYMLGLGFMALALASPIVTWWVLREGPTLPPLSGPSEMAMATFAAPALEPLSFGLRLRLALASALPWILGGWALGSAGLALRLAGGWLWLQRLKAQMEPLEAVWELRLRDLARRMGLRRGFRAGVSKDITSPLVIGWIRPMLLLPASLLTGLDPMGVEALMAHEVAHLLRYDVLFNWMQCAVEVLLFYHPAVWWLSRRTRLERECCCDDAAVAFCGDPLRYAETLNLLDDLQSLDLIPAQAAHGANLMYRITRLLIPQATAPRLPLALPTLALLGAGTFALAAHAPTAGPQPPAGLQQVATPQASKEKAAQPKVAPEKTAQPKPSGKPAEPKEETLYHRKISFSILWRKEGGPKLDLTAEYVTRAEVEEALRRIESLVKSRAGENAGGEGVPSSGSWELKPMKNADDLLRFRLNQVSISEARQLF